MSSTVHIVGAGLAGLSAAVRLVQSGVRVVLHEANKQAGGRCRSFPDAATGLTIDNGNHLLLSGNHAARDYLRTIGSEGQLVGPASAEFPFVDLATNERWTLRLNEGRLPWWVTDTTRRVPGTSLRDYLAMAPLLWAASGRTVCDAIPCNGALYERLVRPLLVAALNVDPQEGDATLAAKIIRETLLAGGSACRPLVARDGLTPAFIDPALAFLRERGAAIHLEHELRAITFADRRITALDFGAERIALGEADRVVLAIPPYGAAALVPGLSAPSAFRAIANAHFAITPPSQSPPLTGVVNGTVEWIFTFPDRVSVTISAADRLMNEPREALARAIWDEVSGALSLPEELPAWQIVRERRATFAATPAENAKRPGPESAWSNLFLAGDWTDTGLPATIEGAIRSGHRAAQSVVQATAP